MSTNIICERSFRNYSIIINRKSFYNQPTDSEVLRYEETIKVKNRAN